MIIIKLIRNQISEFKFIQGQPRSQALSSSFPHGWTKLIQTYPNVTFPSLICT